jgi:hypothetical protein
MSSDLKYKPYILSDKLKKQDWVSKLELDCALQPGHGQDSVKVLVLHGPLCKVSYSRCLAYEFARILDK